MYGIKVTMPTRDGLMLPAFCALRVKKESLSERVVPIVPEVSSGCAPTSATSGTGSGAGDPGEESG